MLKFRWVVVGLLLCVCAGTAKADSALTFGDGQAWEISITDDIRSMFTVRSFSMLGAGGALAAGALAVEDPSKQSSTFQHYGEVPDIGNAYGDWRTILSGSAVVTAVGALAHQPQLTSAGVDLLRSYVYSTGAVVGMKLAFNRRRPDGERYSFPSGHTSAAFSTAPVLAHHFGPWVGAAAYLLSAATAVGRMEENKHYLSDVIFGAAVGYVAGDAIVGQRRGRMSHLKLEADRVGFQVRF